MKKLDCMGDFCPIPTLKTIDQIQRLNPGEMLEILVDHSCAVENIKAAAHKLVHQFRVEEVANGIWRITIEK
ncbi:sulfurtransferase TusA family protein [Hydrogenispora ethanolica]|nr:sulfurtransferase TusA family protein [Hydrogenispora ethanolica]